MHSFRQFCVFFKRPRFRFVCYGSVLTMFAFMILVAPSSAWEHHIAKWPIQGNDVPVTYSWGSNLQGQSAWRTAFGQARDDWNTRPTKVQWIQNDNSLNVWNTYFADDGNAGYAYRRWNTTNYYFIYCDAFGNTFSGYSTTGNQRRSTAGHELGHCLGLEHSNVHESLMRTPRDRNVIFSPRQDDVDGINAKYP